MSIEKFAFGFTPDGTPVERYVLTNDAGVRAEFLTYGATWRAMLVPDRTGALADVLLGFDELEGYRTGDYEGMVVGRYANRIANGTFELGGRRVQVTKNENGETCLHGGGEFSHAVWKAQPVGQNALRFTYHSPDGAQGFPGHADAMVLYTLTPENALKIDYVAVSDQANPFNLTNHAYFNLGGYDSGEISGHLLQIDADRFTVTDGKNIPTGELRAVDGTPFDFRRPKAIGQELHSDYEQLTGPRGYDHNFCLNGWDATLRRAVTVREPLSGRVMTVDTDLPGVQLYTGNWLDSPRGKGGKPILPYTGFALETQYYPDTPNHPEFPQCTTKPGYPYHSSTVFSFSVSDQVSA